MYLALDKDGTEENRPRFKLWHILVLGALLAAGGFKAVLFASPHQDVPEVCKYNSVRPHYAPDEARINGRHKLFNVTDTILQNATVIDGNGEVTSGLDIKLSQGTIVDIGKNLDVDDCEVVDLVGRYVSPGLIDMHSHFGTRQQPQLYSTEDTNEFTSPVTPYMRSLDAIDPHDPDMDSIVASGVTTHLVLTGSRNLISGESYAIKLHHPPHNEVREMLVQYDLPEDQLDNKPVRWMKMAYGENEKNYHLQRGEGFPVSRMGESSLLREWFSAAKDLMVKQDKWCSATPESQSEAEYPTDYKLDTLVSALRGDLNINIHVYETYDMEALFRTADEFGFHINSFHHALAAWKIPELLKEHNTSVALFADDWGGKKEQYQGTVYAPKMLDTAGIPVAIKTDHPALPGQELLFYAQIAHNYGLPASRAIASVTSVPADTVGLGHRIGYVRKGYDADLAIWEMHPLALGAYPVEVIIDGEPNYGFASVSSSHVEAAEGCPKQRIQRSEPLCKKGMDKFIVTGVKENLLSDGTAASALLVENGSISGIKESHFSSYISKGYPVINLHDAYAVPAPIAISPSIGLTEMTLEEATSDGTPPSGEFVHASDGIHTDGILLERLRRSGVSSALTAPLGNGFVKGISTLFNLASPDLDDAIEKESVAVHFNIGNQAKGTYSSISSQIGHLRMFLRDKPEAYAGLPIAIHTHNAEIMKHIVRLKGEFPSEAFVIVGGQEAYLIADKLAAADISVIVAPWRSTAKFWDNRLCAPLEPLAKSSLQKLENAGVKWAIGEEADASARRLYLDAGWAAKTLKDFNLPETSGLVSANIADIFGLPESKDVMIFEHNPFEFGSSLALSLHNGQVTQCFPNVEENDIGDELF